MLSQFTNLSCYEEFEIQCDLLGISKVDILKEISHKINDYYFFVSNDGIFNWFDLEGNHVEYPGVLKVIKEKYIPKNITKCDIPDNVTSICAYSFYECVSLISIIIPNSVTIIGYGSFAYCRSLKEIIIPDNVTSIYAYSFSYCKSLIKINIPNSVTSIKEDVFYECDSLKQVIFKGKMLDEVKQMKNYPFGIEDESIIKCEK